MNILFILVPVSLVLAALALIGFLWTLRSSQYDDLEGAAARVLLDDAPARTDQPASAPLQDGHEAHARLPR